ncbi:hypothetical protein AB0J86_15010 [Micromonospora sp. NPDC049559]|uniref:hypothetical protein n=1 Tax=Micromonospora sp. NPDC049559 TaxID=3155923 RepID=UPI00343865AE
MSESAIRELLTRAVEPGPPPGVPLPVDDVLARNGRRLFRRRVGRAGAAVVVLLAAGLVTLLPGRSPSALPTPPAATPPATSATPVGDYRARAATALRLLTVAVPRGYTLPERDEVSLGEGASYALRETTWREPGRPAKELYSALLEVQFDGRAAVLTVRVSDLRGAANPLAAADPCEGAFDPDGQERECRMWSAGNGTPVRIAGWKVITGPVRQAVRVSGDTLVMVEQAGRPRPGVYALGRQVLSDQRLADLAADPELLP